MYLDRNARLAEEQATNERWAWLTEGIESQDEISNTSLVLQNSYETMIAEGQLAEGWLESLLNEEEINEAPQVSSSVGTNVIPKVLFPVIRRVMPSLIANQLVSVQPIAARTGVIYNIAYTYSDTKGGITAADEYAGSGQTQTAGPGYSTWYSSEKIGAFTGTIAATSSDSTLSSNTSGFIGTDITQFTIKRIEVYSPAGAAYDTVLSTALDGTLSTGSTVGYNAANGEVTLDDVANSPPWLAEAGNDVTFFVVYDQEASSFIPEMEFSINSQTVNTTERKLKIRWTKEAEQDMKAFHKIDVESELVKVASMEMNYEIDRELLTFISDQVITALSHTHDWSDDAIGGGSGTGGNNTSGNYLDRHRALAQKMAQLGAKVAQYNRQGGANWAVVAPQHATVLAMLPNFKGEISGNSFNISYAGMLNGNMKIYVDPNKTASDEILMGYKSTNSTYGAGVVYSPYTNWMSNTVTHPDNFNSIRGFFSRYAVTKVVRGEFFYSKMNVTNLDLV